ncbi:MAG: alpha/beta fold hydrolase, partial [Patescibacteria group bacterium]
IENDRLMTPVLLTQVKTRDGMVLDGIVVRPRRKTKTALVWLHGLSSRFSSGQPLIRELSRRSARSGITYLKFSTRGHDIVARDRKRFIGSAFEKFEDCVLDIRAIVNFAKRLGCRNIILAGHSTGANKALYYLYKTRDRSVKGLVLVGPLNDILAESKRIGRAKLVKAIAIAGKLKNKNPLALMPQNYGIWTSRRYWSLFHPGEREDVFPYYNPRAGWKELKSVRPPIAVIIGSRDEHLDRPAKSLIEVFRAHAAKSKSFSGIIVRSAGHSFIGKEQELAQSIISWIKGICNPPSRSSRASPA